MRETGEKFFFEVIMENSTQFHTEIVHGTLSALSEYQLGLVDAYRAKVTTSKVDNYKKGKNHYKEIYESK